MQKYQRKIEFKMYPNRSITERLYESLGLYCRVTNTLIEEHRRRHLGKEPIFNFTAMCKELTKWRSCTNSLSNLNAQSLQVSAKRVSLSFDAFFRRLKNGETPGFPRFKSIDRFSGWGYKTYNDGWKLGIKTDTKGLTYNRIILSGIGSIPIRGKGRFHGTPKTCEIMHKKGSWYVSITFNVEQHQVMRPGGKEAAAFDWGIDKLLTIWTKDNKKEIIENPRWLKSNLQALANLQRTISKEEIKAKVSIGLLPEDTIPKGTKLPISKKLKSMYTQVRSLHGKIARQRKDFYHKLSAVLVERFAFLGTEELSIKNMIESDTKIKNKDGNIVPIGTKQKTGMNRGTLDAAPAFLLSLLRYKAEEADGVFAEAKTKILKPSQRCHCCGKINKKYLNERVHSCSCGCICDRDENSAKIILRWMLEGSSWLQPPGTGVKGSVLSETPPTTALAA